MSNRKQRDKNRATDKKLRDLVAPKPNCPACGKKGPHYVGPWAGEPGFFACDNFQ